MLMHIVSMFTMKQRKRILSPLRNYENSSVLPIEQTVSTLENFVKDLKTEIVCCHRFLPSSYFSKHYGSWNYLEIAFGEVLKVNMVLDFTKDKSSFDGAFHRVHKPGKFWKKNDSLALLEPELYLKLNANMGET